MLLNQKQHCYHKSEYMNCNSHNHIICWSPPLLQNGLFIWKKSRPPKLLLAHYSHSINILCKYKKKLGCVFFLFIFVFRKYMFWGQLYGKWARWGRYNLYFEASKVLLLKNALNFFPFLQKMLRYYPWTLLNWSPWGPQPQGIKSPLSPCCNMKMVISHIETR